MGEVPLHSRGSDPTPEIFCAQSKSVIIRSFGRVAMPSSLSRLKTERSLGSFESNIRAESTKERNGTLFLFVGLFLHFWGVGGKPHELIRTRL